MLIAIATWFRSRQDRKRMTRALRAWLAAATVQSWTADDD